jgi:DNA-binding NtrC family response regulator
VRGAFTDARWTRPGRIAEAGLGTLLLDDLHTLDIGYQKQLLQVLDRGRYSPVGADRVQTIACRIVLAMTDDPDSLMEKGLLLKDLRYRFGACAIAIPPLRQRRGEIPSLAEQARQRCAEKTGLEGPTRISEAALALLCEGEYAGNVRELEGIVLCAYLFAKDQGLAEIGVQHLPAGLTPRLEYKRHGGREENRMVVERVLQITGGNVKKAARLLGVSRNTLNAVRRRA